MAAHLCGTWAAIRKPVHSHREYVLPSEIGKDHRHVTELVKDNNARCGDVWVGLYPVVRIVKVEFKIKEV